MQECLKVSAYYCTYTQTPTHIQYCTHSLAHTHPLLQPYTHPLTLHPIAFSVVITHTPSFRHIHATTHTLKHPLSHPHTHICTYDPHFPSNTLVFTHTGEFSPLTVGLISGRVALYGFPSASEAAICKDLVQNPTLCS